MSGSKAAVITLQDTGVDSGHGSPTVMYANRLAPYVQWVSVLVAVAALFTLARLVPISGAIRSLEGWLGRIGAWGPVAYGFIYVAATLLLAPGSVLTITAGVIFGLVWGTVTVSVASTTAVALAFLIGRYAARDAVVAKVRRYPKFDAVDRAIGSGGWRIVALLRLSPAVPFNLQNYLYGVTAIGFWPTVLTSWVTMLPGTVLFVYVGYVSREGLEAAASPASLDVSRWVLLIVGLSATLAVTVYVTRLARRKIAEQTEIEPSHDAGREARVQAPRQKVGGWPWRATVMAFVAFGFVVLSACAYWKQDVLTRLFGPPAVMMREAYAEKPDGPSFDHALYDKILHQYVDEAGWVDYTGLYRQPADLDRYIEAVGDAPFERLGRDEKLALLINGYNAFTLRLILDFWSEELESIKDIPPAQRWDDVRWTIGKHTWSLNQIEHEQIRPKFKEPRIHFALVCAAIGCPPLRNEAYAGNRIEQQLEDQARYVHTHDRWLRYAPDVGLIYLTKLYDWYGGDFRQVAEPVLAHAARYVPALKEALDGGNTPQIRWLDYDWQLNSQKNKKPS